MTVRRFGRLTPVQGLMLGLIGYTLSRNQASLEIPEAQRTENMRQAREGLVRLTGQDFGYDLGLWDRYLREHEEHGYTHPYAYAEVKQALASAQKDQVRFALVQGLEQPAPLPRDSKRMQNKARRLIQKHAGPNPPRAGPPVASDEGVLEVWRWAAAWGHLQILSSLARAACAATPLHRRAEFRAQLGSFIERCRDEGRESERAGFLIAAAELEADRARRFRLYQKAMKLFAQEGDWGGEAYSAHHLSDIYRSRQEFEDWRSTLLHAFSIWAAHNHRKGMGIALIHLGEILERAERYQEACQLYHRARTLLRDHITYITARDILIRVSGERHIPPEAYETDKTARELVAEFFEGGSFPGREQE